MADRTAMVARDLEARRRRKHGASATLVLLEPAAYSSRGYVSLGTVAYGWDYTDPQADQPIRLQVAEGSSPAIAATLRKVSAVAITGAVYEVEPKGTDKPRETTRRVWEYFARPVEASFP